MPNEDSLDKVRFQLFLKKINPEALPPTSAHRLKLGYFGELEGKIVYIFTTMSFYCSL